MLKLKMLKIENDPRYNPSYPYTIGLYEDTDPDNILCTFEHGGTQLDANKNAVRELLQLTVQCQDTWMTYNKESYK